jgi:hypothetical protein
MKTIATGIPEPLIPEPTTVLVILMSSIPKCPACNTNKGATCVSEGMYRCGRCRGFYDATPDEGGTAGTDPARRMMREEERKPSHVNLRRNR